MIRETIIKKCWQCTFGKWWFIDYGITTHGNHHAEVVYAVTKTQAKSIFLKTNDDGMVNAWIRVNVRRLPEMDLLKREPHPILKSLTDAQVRKMKHAVGMGNEVLTNDTFYRNRYVVLNDSDWDDLIAKGLALKYVDTNLEYYYLSREGKNAMISLLPIKRFEKYCTAGTTNKKSIINL